MDRRLLSKVPRTQRSRKAKELGEVVRMADCAAYAFFFFFFLFFFRRFFPPCIVQDGGSLS